MDRKTIVIITLILLIFLIIGFIIIIPNSIFCFDNPDKNSRQRNQLMLKLTKAEDIEECKIISEQIVKLGPDCSQFCMGGGCKDLGQFYLNYMVSCISSIAVRENDQQLCFDKKMNEDMCVRLVELAGFPFDEPSPGCVQSVEKSCVFSFASKANSNTNVTLECDLYEENRKKDDCFWLRATVEQNPEICLIISNELERSWCIYYFALKNHNKTLCNYCIEEGKKDCEDEYDFIEKSNKISDCDNVGHFHSSSPGDKACYLAFAIYNKDSTICSKYKSEGGFLGPIIDDYVIGSYSICKRYTK